MKGQSPLSWRREDFVHDLAAELRDALLSAQPERVVVAIDPPANPQSCELEDEISYGDTTALVVCGSPATRTIVLTWGIERCESEQLDVCERHAEIVRERAELDGQLVQYDAPIEGARS